MNWREKLQEASFRGIPFLTEGVDSTVGRRARVHEFPLRDKAESEDVGAKARVYKINAFVLGDNYMFARTKLREALETKGPGVLVHTYWGRRLVVLSAPVTISESGAHGGMAKFPLEFTEVDGALSQPAATADTETLTEDAAEEAGLSLEELFPTLFDVIGVIEDVRDAAEAIVEDVKSRVRAVKDIAARITDDLDAISRAVDDFANTITSLILLPAQLAASVRGVFTAVLGGVSKIEAALNVARSALDFGGDYPAVPLTTPQRKAQAANQAALVQLFKVAAVTAVSAAVPSMTFETREDAEAARDELSAALALLAQGAGGELRMRLLNLRAALIRHLNEKGMGLAVLREVTPGETLPAVLLAQNLYGDAARAGEIVSRNRVRHPLFVPGGEKLEVLADA